MANYFGLLAKNSVHKLIPRSSTDVRAQPTKNGTTFDTTTLPKDSLEFFFENHCFSRKTGHKKWLGLTNDEHECDIFVDKDHKACWHMTHVHFWKSMTATRHRDLRGLPSLLASSTLPCLNFINNFLDSTQFSSGAPALSYLPTRSDYLEKREVAVSIKTRFFFNRKPRITQEKPLSKQIYIFLQHSFFVG